MSSSPHKKIGSSQCNSLFITAVFNINGNEADSTP